MTPFHTHLGSPRPPRSRFLRALLCAVGLFFLCGCIPAFAQCTWVWNDAEQGWDVTCDFYDTIFIPGTNAPSASGCTNCVRMSEQECYTIKSNIINQADIADSRAQNAYQYVSDAIVENGSILGITQTLKEEGQGFEYYATVGEIPGSTTAGQIEYLLSTPGGQYVDVSQITSSPVAQRYAALGGVDSLYAYYNNTIEPMLDSIEQYVTTVGGYLNDAQDEITDIRGDLVSIKSEANAMNCTACSSGSSDGGGGGSVPSGCPCQVFIEAVETAVVQNGRRLDTITDKIEDIRLRQVQIKTKIDQIKDVLDLIQGDVYKIRSTTDLMTDFWKEDTDFNIYKLGSHILTLSNVVLNVKSTLPPILVLEDYTNATRFVVNQQVVNWRDQGRLVNTGSGDDQIDFGYYSTMNWFQRVEFLLGRIAGIFDTNLVNDVDFSNADKAQIASVENVFSSLDTQAKSTEGQIKSVIDRLDGKRSSFNPFSNFINSDTFVPNQISLMPDVPFDNPIIDGTFPGVSIQVRSLSGGEDLYTLLHTMHSITRFLAFVFLVIIDIGSFYYFVKALVWIWHWYWKVYMAWGPGLLTTYGK